MKTLSLLFVAALLAQPSRAESNAADFELVYTYPIETTLEQPTLRAASTVWPQLFDSAKKTIDLAEFYFTPKTGESITSSFEALKKAGARGVKIRVLAEKKMERASQEGFELLKAIPNLELRVIEFAKIKSDGIQHAKYFVIDGRTAYVGSQNFDWRSLKHIHELGLKIADAKLVAQIAAVFAQDWKAQALAAQGKPVAELNKLPPAASFRDTAYLVASPFAFNPPGVGDSQSELVRLIASADQSLEIQMLDYGPITRSPHRYYPPIDNALRGAALRGVKVKLLVSHWNTEPPAVDHLKSLSLIPNIEVKIATLPEAKDGYIPFSRVIHSKYMVVDGKAFWLGTSNWSGGYLDNSRNLELVVKDAALASKVQGVHAQLWGSEYAAPIDVAKDYPKPKR